MSATQIDNIVIIEDAPLLTDLSPLTNKTPESTLIVSRTGGTSLTVPGVTILKRDFSVMSNANLAVDADDERSDRAALVV